MIAKNVGLLKTFVESKIYFWRCYVRCVFRINKGFNNIYKKRGINMGLPIPQNMRADFLALGITDINVSDRDVEDRIVRFCSPKYSSILVQTLDHQFKDLDATLFRRFREIELKPTIAQALGNGICLVFREARTVRISRAALAALGSHNPEDKEELEALYQRNYVLRIYVALDGTTDIDVEYTQGRVSEAASRMRFW
jgi:hypothetical protein